MNDINQIIDWIETDSARMKALFAVSELGLSDWLIAAGFVRNLIWDKQHDVTTRLNDIDVIYFDEHNLSTDREHYYESMLNEVCPGYPWSVKNQARMHVRNGDEKYTSVSDAMKFWPEQQTAIGARINCEGKVEIQHSFPLEKYFNFNINHNPPVDIEIFNSRISSKGWLTIWPKLKIAT